MPVDLTVACYEYDDGPLTFTGVLERTWDPRLVSSGGQINGCGGTPVLPTEYGYTGGRLSSITPPGQQPMTIGYDSTGRVTSVSRSHNSSWASTYSYTTETSSVAYGVPVVQDGSNPFYRPSMSAASVGQWAQTVAPATAVAIFGPGTTASTTDLRASSVFYMSAAGRIVNTANFAGSTDTDPNGWKISTTNYDAVGNVTSTLSPGNRDIALGIAPGPSGLPSGPANVALALSTISAYSSDGMDLTDVLGPYHLAATSSSPNGTGVRAHTHYTYDTGNELGHPGGEVQHLQTSVYTAASPGYANTWSAGSELDKQSTAIRYALSSSDATGWTFGSPMQVTVDPDGLALSTITRYDSDGKVIESRMPGNPGGGGAGTTLTTYYTGGPTDIPNCVNSAWVNLVCRTRHAAQTPTTGLPSLTSTQVTDYDYLNRPQEIVETVQDDGTGGSRTRKAQLYYENSGYSPRLVTTRLIGGVGTAVADTTLGYDSTTGLPTIVSNGSNTITTSYDDFGRPSTYNDGNGNTSTTRYDSSGRVKSLSESASTNSWSQTLTYNEGGERRNLPTRLAFTGPSALGDFTATYDANGALTTQHSPNGNDLTVTRTPTGRVSRQLVQQGATTLLDESATFDVHGKRTSGSSTMTQDIAGGSFGGSRTYSYDAAGRLSGVTDTPVGGTCTTRTYAFDAHSNRTRKNTYTSASSTCTTNGGVSTVHTYDAADRLLSTGGDTGLAYDAFGRITNLPSAHASTGTGPVSLSYYANDLVRSITQGSNSQTFGLDAAQRLATRTAQNGNTITNHYAGSSDSPSWTDEGGGVWNRYVRDLAGSLSTMVNQSSSVTWHLSNLHGDIVLSQSGSTRTGYASDEFGEAQGATAAGRYGWAGDAQRAADTPGGITLMGVRLYAARLGRFIQTDPVSGGSANAYDYADQDPVNRSDVAGLYSRENVSGSAGVDPYYCGKNPGHCFYGGVSRTWADSASGWRELGGIPQEWGWYSDAVAIAKKAYKTVLVPHPQAFFVRYRNWYREVLYADRINKRMIHVVWKVRQMQFRIEFGYLYFFSTYVYVGRRPATTAGMAGWSSHWETPILTWVT